MTKVRLTVWPKGRHARKDGERAVLEGESVQIREGVVEIRQNIGARLLGGPERYRVTGFPFASMDSYEIEDL